MRKSYKYRIYPSKAQNKIMSEQLEICRKFYNLLLTEKIEAWKNNKISISMYDQQRRIPILKETNPELQLNIPSSVVLQDVATRIDGAFKNFFRRVKHKKQGEAPGFPRFKQFGRYDSITYKQYGNGIKIISDSNAPDSIKGKVNLSKIGHIKVLFHRKIEGVIKNTIITRSSTGKWYISFSCDIPDTFPLIKSEENVGIDMGIKTFAYMSNNTKIENPRFFKKEEKNLAKANRKLAKFPKPSKDLPSSKERIKAKRTVARVYERIKFKRENFAHQESRKIINRYQVICLEDLNINKMVQNKRYAKSISDAAWNSFSNLLIYKAEDAGRSIVFINPAYTSQDCSSCGNRVYKSTAVRIHKCKCCGLRMDRDLNASINILRIGLNSLGSTTSVVLDP